MEVTVTVIDIPESKIEIDLQELEDNSIDYNVEKMKHETEEENISESNMVNHLPELETVIEIVPLENVNSLIESENVNKNENYFVESNNNLSKTKSKLVKDRLEIINESNVTIVTTLASANSLASTKTLNVESIDRIEIEKPENVENITEDICILIKDPPESKNEPISNSNVEILDNMDYYLQSFQIELNRLLYFNELPFPEYDSENDEPRDEPRPSSSSTNNDLHDSGITSSSSRTSEGQLSDEMHESRGEFPIPLQVVAYAEGFGFGEHLQLQYERELEFMDIPNDTDLNSEHELMTCLVCFDSYYSKQILHCYECDLYICLKCMVNHITSRIYDGVIRLYCAGSSCSRLLSDQMISAFCPDAMPIFVKNRIEVENNPLKKTCPNCHKVEVISDLNDLNQRKIKCDSCSLLWCHSCYTPWHSGLTCQIYQKDVVGAGKKALKFWAKSKGKNTKNARKCPYCHFYIERISGCDHMKCIRCDTDFCYKCGAKHRSLGWLGNHYSTYSFLGCKYNLLPKKPALRILVRTSAFCGVVLGAPVAAFLVVTGALCFIAFSPILLPILVHRKCIN